MGKDYLSQVGIHRNLIPYACLFWVFVNLDSFFIWNRLENILRVIAALGVFYASYSVWKQELFRLPRKDFIPFVFISLYYLWHTFSVDDNLFKLIGRALGFVPLLFIMFWPPSLLSDIYSRFRKIIIFFAVGSAIVSVLAFAGILDYLPYYVLGPRSALHERMGIEYHVYGFFVTNYGDLEFLPRACGMLQEPGHFAIILGFVYMTDRLLGHQFSWWVVVCGVLTFSSAFFLVVFVTELFNIYTKRQVMVVLSSVLGILLLLGVVYFSMDKNSQEQINYLAYERNLKDVVSAGSLTKALDERTNSTGDAVFRKITPQNIWMGLNLRDNDVVLSDYRGVIVQSGLVGLLLLLFACFFSTRGLPIRKKMPLFFLLVLVMIHRSWMFGSSYLFFLSFMATTTVFCTLLINDEDYEEIGDND